MDVLKTLLNFMSALQTFAYKQLYACAQLLCSSGVGTSTAESSVYRLSILLYADKDERLNRRKRRDHALWLTLKQSEGFNKRAVEHVCRLAHRSHKCNCNIPVKGLARVSFVVIERKEEFLLSHNKSGL
jgi:hypothetical protein